MDFPAAVLRLLCPVCVAPLVHAPEGRRLECASGHRYDAAKQGYFNLLTGRGTPFREDTAQMVSARADFLEAGHYAPLAEAVAEAVGDALGQGGANPARVLDAGAGTGYYLAHVLRRIAQDTGTAPGAVALDISRYAMRRAAKLPGTLALVWDLWRPLPLADASVDVLLNVFAPRNAAEFTRVVAPGGAAVVVTPLPGHLAEASGPLGLLAIAEGKEESVAQGLAGGFALESVREVRSTMRLGVEDAVRLAVMGPAGHHLDAGGLRARLAAEGVPAAVTAAFRVQVFRRRGPAEHTP